MSKSGVVERFSSVVVCLSYHSVQCSTVDFIIAQVGLVYCFAGGYYPTLFAALTAAQQCGWQTMLYALEDLIEEATIAIEAASREVSNKAQSYRDAVTRKTMVVLAAIDPVKVSSSHTHRILGVCSASLRSSSSNSMTTVQFPKVSPTCLRFFIDQHTAAAPHNLVGGPGLGREPKTITMSSDFDGHANYRFI
jgi:hypothetical protein